MCLHVAFAGFGTFRPLRHFDHTHGLYTYRGLPASCFAIPWRAAKAKFPDETPIRHGFSYKFCPVCDAVCGPMLPVSGNRCFPTGKAARHGFRVRKGKEGVMAISTRASTAPPNCAPTC
jgi:hypothetical protein